MPVRYSPHIGWLLGALLLNGLVFGLDAFLLALQTGVETGLHVPELALLRGLALVASYTALFVYFHRRYQSYRPEPLEALWTVLLAGLGLLLLAYGFDALSGSVEHRGAAGGIRGLLRARVFDLGQALYTFWTLFNLRELVLFKRTLRAVRYWNAMLVVFALSAFSLFMASYQQAPHLIARILGFVAILLMIWCSMRLAWIVYLPARKKLLALLLAGLNLLVMAVLLGSQLGFWPPEEVRREAGWLYDYPLEMFGLLTLAFGILYNSTTILSTLFHLPTSSIFERRQTELSSLHNVSRLITEVFDPEKLVRTVTTSAAEAVGARAAWLEVLDWQSGTVHPRLAAWCGIEPEQIAHWVNGELSRIVLENRQTVVLHSLEGRSGSLVVVPLYARQEPIGVLYVLKEVSFGFEADDVLLLRTLADQAALVLENARLFTLSLERERLKRELEIARRIQQRLLPLELPRYPGLHISARAMMAEEVGGDYYDFYARPDGRLAFAIADVSGKGISAAFYMAELKGIFQVLARESLRPVELLTRINEALSAHLESRLFVSMLVGWMDMRTFRVHLARAGHPPALLRRSSGETCFLRTRGPGLGLVRDGRFSSLVEECELQLDPGDLFLLYTDGLIELRNERGEEFGYERLFEIVHQHGSSARELEHALLEAVATHRGANPWHDDLTLVILQRTGGEP